MKKYCYLFLPKNLIPEQVAIQAAQVAIQAAQVAIQAAHVAMVTGQRLQYENHEYCANHNPSEITFVMTPAYTDWVNLEADLNNLGCEIEIFQDFTYTFDEEGALIESELKEIKAMMTHPIDEDKRGILRGLPLYRIKK